MNVPNWMERRMIRDWRLALRLWSVRVNLLVGLAAILVTLLALISDEVKALIGWKAFAGAFFVLSVVGLVARLANQGEDTND